jgi:predicted dehydrogenase
LIEANRLIEGSKRLQRMLMVDHTFGFETVVLAIARVLCAGELGPGVAA